MGLKASSVTQVVEDGLECGAERALEVYASNSAAIRTRGQVCGHATVGRNGSAGSDEFHDYLRLADRMI